MSTLMSAMLVLLGQDLDDDWRSTTTSAGNANKLTLEDTALYEKVADWVSDGMIVHITSGTCSGETRVVDSLSGTTLTVKNAFSAQIAISVTYEIHRLFTRNQKLVALRNSAPLLCPDYHEVVRNMETVETTDYKYEFTISSLSLFNNKPHQVLLSQQIIRNIWVAATAYVVGDYVRPTSLSTFTGYVYKCTIAGTSHATTEPTWPTTIGGTVTETGKTTTWECQEELDYSNYPFLPLHDWDITPDGKLFIPYSFTEGYKIMIVGIKPLAFSGSGASELVGLDSPFTYVLSAQAALYLCQQRVGSAPSQVVERWTGQVQFWNQHLALRKIQYPMLAPAGTLISGPGLSV